MKLVTYNIHRGRSRAERPVLREMAAALAACGADIVACQEVLAEAVDGHADQAAWLAARIGMQCRFTVNAMTRRGPLGNATLCRRPITSEGNLDLSVPGHERRGALMTRDEAGTVVWNAHLGLTRRQRHVQWRLLRAAIAADDGGLVVCGDLNDWDGSLGRRIARSGLTSALAAVPRRARTTFPARRPWLALDRVYCRGMRVLRAEVLRGPPWSTLSDHLPIEVTLVPDDSPVPRRPAR